MLSTRRRHRLPLFTVAAAAAAAVAGCSSGAPDRAVPEAPTGAAEQSVAQSADSRIAVSPGGVTTKINVPAQSMEEQYAQACMNAKDWMTARGGDPKNLVEPFLKEVQSSDQVSPAAFGKTWPQLSEAEQAAVIIAVEAAADGGC